MTCLSKTPSFSYTVMSYNLGRLITFIPEGKQIYLFNGDIPSVLDDCAYRSFGQHLTTSEMPDSINARKTVRTTQAGKVTTTWTVWIYQLDNGDVYIYRPLPSEIRHYTGMKLTDTTPVGGNYVTPANMNQLLRLVVTHVLFDNKGTPTSEGIHISEHQPYWRSRVRTPRDAVKNINVDILLANISLDSVDVKYTPMLPVA